ncbi:enhanced serine sensitivity protein SseB C-terminal domain-containing protein [Enterococcus quebecensis]|uniref:SseB protein C-terminal domain-containing protein n=1 Tax=Enterococcus quebecensis TaxID=903983 RepID=A0A1E5GV13_9ENTE|nr:enhanced serine sensitivity protein SseB C-terminal domain-containing protein [Enterococcus quebecensis]OEG16515.1 hypothetical protein BCR23_06400 [Enterococcus quebecensis]OJG74111.1 hypothetical protein RV12_GL002749 [Enterococcus quebecensis]
MDIFKFFKKEKKNKPTNFFNFQRNNDGVQKVIDWVKISSEIIIDIDSNKCFSIGATQEGKRFLSAYTDVSQHVPSYRKEDRFMTVSFEYLGKIFEENSDLDFLWLNPNSDSIQLNRSVFTSKHAIKKNTEIQIGLPAEKPVVLIDFLSSYARQEVSIKAIYLGLMRHNNEFSYAVFIDSENAEKIIPEIGPKITEICLADNTLYPVDFVYDNFLNDEQYLVYSR